MSGFKILKDFIISVIYPNVNNEITGDIMQRTLLAIVDSLGKFGTFAGIANKDTSPNAIDQNVFYIASEKGNYPGFGIYGLENVSVIYNSGEGWKYTPLNLDDYLLDPEGTYPKMSVGFAENVVSDGSATAEVFSFRPTAGINRNTLNDGAARIQTLEGNSVVINQFAKLRTNTATKNGINVTNDGVKATVIGTAEANTNVSIATALIPVNHKCILKGCPTNASVDTFFLFVTDNGNKIDVGEGVLFTNTNNETIWINITIKQGVTVDFVIYPCLYDLTQMFGAGNEPTTVAEFYQRMPLGAGLDVYNEGTIVDGHYGAIKTTGFNQWDEQWEQGAFDYYTGAKIADNSRIRSKNFIPVFPATQYYYKMPTNWQVCYWDAEKQFISASQNSTDVAENTPQNCHYITFDVGYSGAPITEYNNDICISLYWPTEYGDLYGTYQPYKPFERDLSWVAKYFPNGMRSAGNVADEIRFNSTEQRWEAVKRVDTIDLSRLSWELTNLDNVFYSFISTMRLPTSYDERKSGMLCSKYAPSTNVALSTMLDKSMLRMNDGVGNFYIKDTAFTSLIDFKTALQGVMLNYELAEPIVVPITENINFDYDVSDYGTEELIVAEGVESAPLSASIEYSPNVLAMLKNAPGIANDVDMLKSQLSAITAQLAALTATNNE